MLNNGVHGEVGKRDGMGSFGAMGDGGYGKTDSCSIRRWLRDFENAGGREVRGCR